MERLDLDIGLILDLKPGYATCAESFAVSGNNLFVGVCEGTALVNGGGVFLSTTNGENWTQANSGIGNSSVRSIAISGSNMFAATDGKGIFLSANNGESWTPVDSGLPDTTHTWVQSLAVSGGNILPGLLEAEFSYQRIMAQAGLPSIPASQEKDYTFLLLR